MSEEEKQPISVKAEARHKRKGLSAKSLLLILAAAVIALILVYFLTQGNLNSITGLFG